MRTPKPFLPLLLALGLSGCFGQNLTAPTGVASITPASGPWQVTVDGHPEVSGTFTFNFVTNQGPSRLEVTTATGKTARPPLKWTSGNFDVYINYPIDGGYQLSEKLSLAILSDTRMQGVYTYNAGGSVPTLGNGPLGGGTVSNNQPSYQATCTAIFGAAASSGATTAASAAPGK